MGEDLLLQDARTLHQRGQVADGVQPFVEQGFQLAFRLGELGHLQVDERQLVVEHLLRLQLHQLHLVVVVRPLLLEAEVQDADGVDALQLVVPHSLGGLLADGEGGVIDAAVLEELLLALLHLHQEVLPLLVLAIHVEHGTAVVFLRAQTLRVEVGDVPHHFLPVQQRVEEADEQLLVDFRTEQLLESEVGIKVHVSFDDAFRTHGLDCLYGLPEANLGINREL